MKYLHENGFRVLTVNDLGYDSKNSVLYMKSSPSNVFNQSQTIGAITTGALTK